MSVKTKLTAHFHLPGLFEFYELYSVFLPLYGEHREYFYDWCDIGSVYGAPADCVWGGGRAGFGNNSAGEVLDLLEEYGISARLTFSNSLLTKEHLSDKKCNSLCKMFSGQSKERNGVIIHSDLLLDYITTNYPGLYKVSSTTKVITDFDEFISEINRNEFKFVVPDFRLNKEYEKLKLLTEKQKDKVEFLCNECCYPGCKVRKQCYENVSRMNIGETSVKQGCCAPYEDKSYSFSKAMDNPYFIGTTDILNYYLRMGFSNFKIEGRSLGSAIVLEMLIYYMVKPEYQIHVREAVYLDSSLDLF